MNVRCRLVRDVGRVRRQQPDIDKDMQSRTAAVSGRPTHPPRVAKFGTGGHTPLEMWEISLWRPPSPGGRLCAVCTAASFAAPGACSLASGLRRHLGRAPQ
jgi:hypothetical protein